MKLTKLKLRQIIKESLHQIIEGRDYDDYWGTGVPEEDVLTHGADTEKYPTTDAEQESDRIAQKLEDIWLDAGNRRKDLGYVDNQIIDLAIEVRNGDMDFEEAVQKVKRLSSDKDWMQEGKPDLGQKKATKEWGKKNRKGESTRFRRSSKKEMGEKTKEVRGEEK